MSDWELLQDYVRTGSGAAFAQLVERHIRWVHSVCARRTRDAHLAEDVTQAVFLLLSQKAARLPVGTSITGWLFTTARLASSNAMQSQRRRLKREMTYAARQPTEVMPSTTESPLVSAIELGLSRLRQSDRDLLIAHFYGEKTLVQAATETGLSAQAARKRFTRAMDALKERIAQQGVAVPSLGGAAALISATDHALPPSLAAWLAGGASPAAVSSGAAAIATTVSFKSTTALLLSAGGAVAVAVAVTVYFARPPTQPPPAARKPPAIALPSQSPAPVSFTSAQLTGHNMPVSVTSVSPNGHFGVSRSSGELVRWDLTTSKAIGNPLPTFPLPTAAAIADTGLVVALDRRDILIFDSPSALIPRRITETPGRPAVHWSLAIAPGAHEIAAGDADGSIHLLDLNDGHETSSFPAHAHAINTLVFSPDGKSILSGGIDDHAIILSDRARCREVHHFDGHTSLISALGFSPDGQTAFSFGRNAAAAQISASAPAESAISIWDLATGTERRKLSAPAGVLAAATFTPDGHHLAAISNNHIIIWDIATGQELNRQPLPDAKNIPLAGSFSQDGRVALIGGGLRRRNILELIDLKTALTQLPAHRIFVSPRPACAHVDAERAIS